MSNTNIRTSILLAGLLALGGFANAQTPLTKGDGTDNKVKAAATAPAVSDTTRADVKADAKASNKALPVNKSGEAADLSPKPSVAGEAKTRADVKADAKLPLKTGEGVDKGKGERQTKGMTKKQRAEAEAKTSNATLPATDLPAARADVKAEAKAANKAQ
ncbi:MAG: hypothetical protein V4757_22530 [Pseudomonadota bacterium]